MSKPVDKILVFLLVNLEFIWSSQMLKEHSVCYKVSQLTIIHQFTQGLERFSIYSGFGLDRFSIYSGFGLDRFHCIRCLFLFVAFVLLVAVKLVNWPCLRRLSYSQIQVMIMSACNVTYDIEGWSIPYVCLIYRYSKVKDPCRIRFWWVPTKIRTSAFFCKNCEWKTQVMSPELA
jgi:hypothetical protein